MRNQLYPLQFEPVFKDYIWGGRNLETIRDIPKGIIAESWEIAGHKDGTTAVANGIHKGKLLTDLLNTYGLDLIGKNNAWAFERDKFPLLIKILDANRELSVQVHPDDTYALANEGNELGKTEMWVVLHAEPNAQIILGVTEGTTAENFRAGIQNGKLEPHLHYLSVQKGDVVCVPAGSLHAILNGLMIAEIQQNSNTTYRVYDWNRVGNDGKPRPLHIDKAIDVINFDQVEPSICTPPTSFEGDSVKVELLCENKYFRTERITLAPNSVWKGNCDGTSLEIWGCIEGNSTFESNGSSVSANEISFTLLPAAMGEFELRVEGEKCDSASPSGPAVFLRSYVP